MLKNKNAFITYEPNTDTYRFHPLLRQCLQNRFSKLPTDRQCKIYSVHSAWYYRVMDYYQAAIFAYKSQDYQAMLTAIAKLQAEHLTSSQKMTLLQQFLVCPRQISRINPHAEIIIAQIAIKQDRPCIYKPLLAELPADIASAPHLVRDEKYSLYCLLELLLGSMPDSEDIDEHLIHFIKAYQWYIESHYTKPEPIPEGGDCLSVLFQVLHDNTLLNEISDSIKKIYSFYDNIIIGKQSGRIDLYEAEVRFYQCDLTEAQIAIDKCIAKALQNQDWMLYLRAQFISTRLCCMKGLPLVCTTIREALASNGNKHLIYMWDVIEGFSYGLHGCPDHAASWLIHENTGNLDMYESLTPIAYIVHCILLFARHEYIQLIATAEHFLEDRHFNESCLYCLYLKILLASANHAIGRSLVGKDLLRSALQIAISNQLYMPFVELGAAVMPLLDGLNTNGIPEQAITTIRQVYLTIQTSKHESLNKSQPGRMDVLTRREHQIASHVSSGMTNRQIAKQLYITENTVKSALKSIFGKLNISRREELAILVHTNFDTAL